jgi:hypothetical protein
MEPISTATAIALQIGVSLINQWFNKDLTEKIKEEQRRAKENELLNNQRRDEERFRHSCELQERMELDGHLYKIKTIKNNFLNSFETMIHKENLENSFRLNVSPYIIQRSVIPLSTENIGDIRQDLFCILTSSNNSIFNRDVFPFLDEEVSGFISKYWNEASNHTVCYYQNLWDLSASSFSNEDIENVKSLITTPTIALTPYFTNEDDGFHLTLKVNAWGLGFSDTKILSIPSRVTFKVMPNKYTLQDIEDIFKGFVPLLDCTIGHLADVFYWSNFYQPPLLPKLIGENYIRISDELMEMYISMYHCLYKTLAIGQCDEAVTKTEEMQNANEIVRINLYNFPERSVSFLKRFMILSQNSSLSSEVLRESVLGLYRVKTDSNVRVLEEIDASRFSTEDFNVINQYICLAKEYGDKKLLKDFSEIIRRKVISWR